MSVIGFRRRVPRADAPVNSTVDAAVAALRAGRMVIVVDAENPHDDGDLMLAATHATPERVAFMVRHTSGILCVPMPAADLDRLRLPPMVAVNEDPKGAVYSVSVERPNRYHQRNLGGRPGQDDLAARRPRYPAGRPEPARPRVPAAGRRRRRAAPGRAHRSGRRPGAAGRAAARRGDRRSGRRRRGGRTRGTAAWPSPSNTA